MLRFLRIITAIWLACACLIAGSAVLAQELTDDLAPPEPPNTEQLPNRTIETGSDIQTEMKAPVLTVDQERLFVESAWGQRAKEKLEEKGGMIEAENERLAQQLSDEEAELTRKRETMDPAEFRKLAEAFDARATEIRRERAQVVQELNARSEADRNSFYQAALPIMGEVMQRRGAVAVLDRRTVFVSLDSIDITDELIAELDKHIGEGPLPATGEEGAPDQDSDGD